MFPKIRKIHLYILEINIPKEYKFRQIWEEKNKKNWE